MYMEVEINPFSSVVSEFAKTCYFSFRKYVQKQRYYNLDEIKEIIYEKSNNYAEIANIDFSVPFIDGDDLQFHVYVENEKKDEKRSILMKFNLTEQTFWLGVNTVKTCD